MTPEDIEKLAHELNKNKEPRIQMPILTMAHIKYVFPIRVSLVAFAGTVDSKMGNVATDGVIAAKVRPDIKGLQEDVRDIRSGMVDLKDDNSESNQAIVRIDNDIGAMRSEFKFVRVDVADIKETLQKMQDPKRHR